MTHAATLRLAEDNHLFKEEHVPHAFLAAVPHNELSLSMEHPLFLKVDLKQMLKLCTFPQQVAPHLHHQIHNYCNRQNDTLFVIIVVIIVTSIPLEY